MNNNTNPFIFKTSLASVAAQAPEFILEDFLKYKSRLERIDKQLHKLIKQLKKHHKISIDIENRNLKKEDFINE